MEPSEHLPGHEPSTRRRRLRGDRGQGMVEFALILPVFMLLILGLLDFGSAYNIHNQMTQLAGEAVRFASVNNCGGTACIGGTIESQVRNDAPDDCLRLGGSDHCGQTGPQERLQVCFYYPVPDDPDAAAAPRGAQGSPVTAVVKTTFQWLPFLDLGTNVTLRASATMRIEQPLTDTSSDVYEADSGDCT